MTDQEYIDYISKEPTEEMVKEAKDKEGNLMYKYILKSILQKELLNLYKGNYKFEILREVVTNSSGVWGVGLLHYKHPVSGEWLYVSGTAYLPSQYEMKLLLPKLEAHIFLNACKKIGVWFGQTINNNEDAVFEEGLPTIQLKKKTMDVVTLKKYQNAVKAKDQKTIDEIELNYETPLPF